ncbi:hypothetical protein AVO45_09100 [Ruegeria marisrubri]|uniref:Uncharacterized protein n=1 Tax=Ruegeria marisrubri TaxID=1685379 RepID=A0A0X3TQT3_9RHOB|nr:hypothetical protein AVO45_09100 [Ruegeria marisrubri]
MRVEFGDDFETWLEQLYPLLTKDFWAAFDTLESLAKRAEQIDRFISALKKASSEADSLLSSMPQWLHLMEERDDIDFYATYKTLKQAEKSFEQWRDKVDKVLRQISRRGGRDPRAIMLAQLTAGAFSELGEPVTFGQTYDGKPSTRFGRVVEMLLEVNGIPSHWRRPTQRACEEHKKRSELKS